MLPDELKTQLERKIAGTAHPRELVVDIMFALQDHYGHLTDDAVAETAALLGMTAVEVDELATFYPFIYREPVGRYVIHVCDSVVCWMGGHESLQDHLMQRLGIAMGETTADGLFTLLPVCCIGYCDRAPAILINKKVYGELTPEKLDNIIARLRDEANG
ncbi:MAG: NADH-quinone oxidoreductase subunit NuoE [Deltaproteobacteria bacterium]|jgi:NADH-quinone oxidoreductase subunit E|nr:NADH-quinone oxidoreductase subunit NuoE [Deltaproteobacteria bacterium]